MLENNKSLGIIYVLHGSKKPLKQTQMQSFLAQLKLEVHKKYGIDFEKQLVAYLEHDHATIEFCLLSLARQGISKFIIQPLLLFPASHALEDIPLAIKHFKENHPQYLTQIEISNTFGKNKEIIQIAKKRYQECLIENSWSTAKITFIIHGSFRFDQPFQDFSKLCKEYAPTITPTVIYGEQTWQNFVTQYSDENKILVPIFLFNGHLITRIKNELKEISDSKNTQITKTLELDELLISAIIKELDKEME